MIAGYDFGWVRAEVEVGYKEASADTSVSQAMLDDINSFVRSSAGTSGLPE